MAPHQEGQQSMVLQDRNFDDLAKKFKRKIGDDTKGQLRRDIFWQTINQDIPELLTKPLRILDAGGGLGHTAIPFAKGGHEVIICDISYNMLTLAKTAFAQQVPDAKVTFLHTSIQTLHQHIDPHFDLILCHAVLEWLAKPETIIEALVQWLKPNAWLSLMFYNKHALVFRNLMRGNLRKVKSGNVAGEANSLTPPNPLYPDTVIHWLQQHPLQILTTTGMRIFYDALSKQNRDKISFEDILEMELAHCQTEPYRSLGRYLHLLCKKSC